VTPSSAGWLFYDFRHSDPLAYRILKLDEKMLAVAPLVLLRSQASGEPVKIVQSIEQFKLDSLPGKKLVFRGWQELHARLREALGAPAKGSKSRIAMQYSPMNDIPYISRVDAGTIELVRSFGVEPVTERGTRYKNSRPVFSPAQHQMHVEASTKCIGSFRRRLPRLRAVFGLTNQPLSGTSRSSCSVVTAKKGWSRSR
jgi:Xaa-Pro aminopeptidase